MIIANERDFGGAGRQGRTIGRHHAAILDCRGEVVARRWLEGSCRYSSGFSNLRGWRFTNGDFLEFVDIVCAFALATSLVADRDPYYGILMMATKLDQSCDVSDGQCLIKEAPEASLGTAILRWFGLRVSTGFTQVICCIERQPPARAVFAARSAIVKFFRDKGLAVPPQSPDWLVDGDEVRPVVANS